MNTRQNKYDTLPKFPHDFTPPIHTKKAELVFLDNETPRIVHNQAAELMLQNDISLLI